MIRIGSGWDLHRPPLRQTAHHRRRRNPSEKGPLAHSDGDVLIHALIDALLGALAKGTSAPLPRHHPACRTSTRWSSKSVLQHELPPYSIINVDATIILQDAQAEAAIDAIRTYPRPQPPHRGHFH